LPTLIKISTDGNFFDKPDHIRKVHTSAKPNIGGIAIFLSFLFGCILFLKATAIEYSNFLLGATMIIFSMGVRDDFLGLNAYKKMILQVLAAVLVVVFAEVRNTSFYGLLGVFELNYLISVPFSVFVIIVITNAFNLIDGIDALATSIGIGFLFVPLFDTLRAFILRISQGKSPLFADRQHIHHFFLDRGWSHTKIALLMSGMSLFFIGLCLVLQGIGSFT